MGCSVLLLATMETKHEAIAYFREAVAKYDVDCHILDLSLKSKGAVLSGADKLQSMSVVAEDAKMVAQQAIEAGAAAAVSIGGGTGGAIALDVMRDMPFAFPKMLITTLPFDPRYALADNAITIVPTLADVCGLNAPLRQVLEKAAAMLAGLCQASTTLPHVSTNPSVGITALGVTGAAADRLVAAIKEKGEEATVFHANGFGGAAYARFARCNTFHSVVDLTCHELTRQHVAGAHVEMPDRFSAARDAGVPQIVLPGGMNFIGLGELSLVPPAYLERPHYRHSKLFTHVQVTVDEMERVAQKLVGYLNGSTAPTSLVVPMGGFSHEDRAGGAIESPELRRVFLKIVEGSLRPHVGLKVSDSHINDAQITDLIMDELARCARSTHASRMKRSAGEAATPPFDVGKRAAHKRAPGSVHVPANA
ncbi:MAG: Tm-1-like ATP-binding domain-containing protein [Pseudomonadota bacterium]